MSDVATTDILVRAGTLFCFSSGKYSDYGYNGHYLALENITRTQYNEIAEKVRAGESADPESADPHGVFQAALIRAGIVMSITCIEIHLGNYSELEDQ